MSDHTTEESLEAVVNGLNHLIDHTSRIADALERLVAQGQRDYDERTSAKANVEPVSHDAYDHMDGAQDGGGER